MEHRDLIDRLHFLGIDEANYRLVAILPLVQVAWADGRIQDRERDRILAIAEREGLADEEATRVLRQWLTHEPSHEYFQTGRDVVLALARAPGDLALTAQAVDEIVARCEEVAKAAGGLFGLAFTVDANERRALGEIAEALRIAPSELQWSDLQDGLET